jgi:hypothetical protein
VLYYCLHDSAVHNKRQGAASCAVPRHIGGGQGIGGDSVACSASYPGEKSEQAGVHIPVEAHEKGDSMNGLVVIGMNVGLFCCAQRAREMTAFVCKIGLRIGLRFGRRGWAARDALRRV